ncbi:MAG TPA: DUF2934 domain-containing protein [Bryobacteraceae bacterium]|jgi:hypothetical protein
MQSEPKTKRTRKSTGEAPAKTHRAAKKAVEPKAVAVATSASLSNQASHHQIAQLAYSYWESRGFQGGSPEEDWFRAEGELRTSRTA